MSKLVSRFTWQFMGEETEKSNHQQPGELVTKLQVVGYPAWRQTEDKEDEPRDKKKWVLVMGEVVWALKNSRTQSQTHYFK